MIFPPSGATFVTAKIMSEIKQHLKELPSPQENYHFNRSYEIIYRILKNESEQVDKDSKPLDP